MKKRFTMVEMIAVVLIISALVGIAYVNLKPFQKESITSMISSNTSIMQTAVDKYRFDNDMQFPTAMTPTVSNPQELDMDKLYPKYLTKKPDLSKEKGQRYWVDIFGKVWGATIDAPSGFTQTNDYLEWRVDPNVEAYQVYSLSTNKVTGAALPNYLKKVASLQVNPKADKMKFESKNADILVSAIDRYGFETVPAGLAYGGQIEDWFEPLLNKEGTFTFEIQSFDMMYWEGFRSIEDKPEGTSITYKFSVLDEDGKFTPYTTDFYTIPPSTHLKMQVELRGKDGKYPTLYDMRVFYHYENDSAQKVQTDRINSSNLKTDGTAIDTSKPVSVVDEFTMYPGMKLDSVVNSDTYTVGNEPRTTYTYSQDGENFIPVSSFDKIPEGSIVRVERTYSSGEVVVRDLIVKQSETVVTQDGNNSPTYTGGTGSTDSGSYGGSTGGSTSGSGSTATNDPVVQQPEWSTVQTMNFIAHSGDGQKTRWIAAEIDDTIYDETNSRILYRFSGSNGYGWSAQVDDISKLGMYQSVKMTAYIQVLKEKVGSVEEPTIEGVRLINEKGVADLSTVKPTVRVVPVKSNNKTSEFFSTETKVDWQYEAFDPRGRKIVDVEWDGDKLEQYTTPGKYQVMVRVRNASNYWSDWAVFNFEVKDEKPTAVIRSFPESIIVGKSVTWSYGNSFDTDGDGIARGEWAGDKKSIYTETGTYTIKLRVQDNEGYWSDWVEKTFKVNEEGIIVYRVEGEDAKKFVRSSESNTTNQTTTLTGASDNQAQYIRGYSSSYQALLRHSFTGSGYDIRLVNPRNLQLYVDNTYIMSITADGEKIISDANLVFGGHTVELRAPNNNHEGYVDYIDVYSTNDTPSLSGIYARQLDKFNNESNVDNNNIVTKYETKSKVYYTLSKNSFVTINVKNQDGVVVRSLLTNTLKTGGTHDTHYIVWDGKDNFGQDVETGSYNLEIKALSLTKKTSDIKTISIFLDSMTPIYRVEGEDASKFVRSSESNTTNQTLDLSGSSEGKAQYIRGYSSSYQTLLRHSFTGTGFDIRLYNPRNLQVYIDNTYITSITVNGEYVLSQRNLLLGGHTVELRAPNSNHEGYVDYIDVYSTNDLPAISNVYTRQLDANGTESNINNNNIIVQLGSKSKTYYTLSKNSTVEINVLNQEGVKVRNLITDHNETGGTRDVQYIVWDGKDSFGKFVPTGLYDLEIKATGVRKSGPTIYKTQINVDSDVPIYRVEGEDGSKFVRSSESNTTNQTLDLSGASENKAQFIRGYSSSYQALLRHSFTGTGFDIRLYNARNLQVYVDNTYVTSISVNGEYILSQRNLTQGGHTVELRTPNSNHEGYVDYIDVFNSGDDKVSISNVYSKQLDKANNESNIVNNNIIVSLSTKTKTYYTISKNSTTSIRVLDSNNNVVKVLQVNTPKTGGTFDTHNIIWNGTDSDGKFVKTGHYQLEITTVGIRKQNTTSVRTSIFVDNSTPIYRVEGEDGSKFVRSSESNTTNQTLDLAGSSSGKAQYIRGYSSSYQALLRHSFTGTGFDIRLYNPRNLQLYVDNTYVTSITVNGEYILSQRNLTLGGHTVELRAPNSNHEGYVDYIDVYSSNDVPTITNVYNRQLDKFNNESNINNNNLIIQNNTQVKTYYTLSKNGYVVIKVKDSKGQEVRLLQSESFETGGTLDVHNIVWNGKDNNGLYVGTGNYTVEISIEGIDRSSKVVATTNIYAENENPIYRVEGEDSVKFVRSSESNTTNQTTDLSGSSQGKSQYIRGYSSSYQALLRHSFTGTGFDVRLYGTQNLQVYVDNTYVTSISVGGEYILSQRNLTYGSHTVELRAPNSNHYGYVDFIDVYSNNDVPTISNIYTRQLDKYGNESNINNNNLIIQNSTQVKTYYTLSKNSYVVLKVKDSTGKVVRTLQNEAFETGGTFDVHSIIWNGRDDNNAFVTTGFYTLEISAQGINKSSTVIGQTTIYAEYENPIYRVEGEDGSKFVRSSESNTTNQTLDLAGSSNGKAQFIRGYSSSYQALLRHSFTGTGFDIRLYNPKNLQVYVDNTYITSITVNGEYILSQRNLTYGGHTVELRAPNSNHESYIDYIDVFSNNDQPSISNIYTRQLDRYNNESNIDNNNIVTRYASKSKTYYRLSKNSSVTIKVKDESGSEVRRLYTSDFQEGGTFDVHTVIWDGKDFNGSYVPTGTYSVEMTAVGIWGTTVDIKSDKFYVDNSLQKARAEGEDSSKVSYSAESNTTNQTLSLSGASNGLARFIRGYSSSYSASIRHSFTGTGFDVRLYNPRNLQVYVDGTYKTSITVNGEYIFSLRNLASSGHTVELRTPNSNHEGYVDFFDTY